MSNSQIEQPVVPQANAALLSFIERASRDPEFDIAKFEALLRLQREVQQEEARRQFNAAMAAVDAEIGPVIRDRLNPAVNRKYATLEAIDAAARPVYSKHGFSVRFGSDKPPKEGWMRVTCTVSHAGGFEEHNYLESPIDVQTGARARTPVQAVGSTVTYLRRYLLQMSFNIVLADDEDDNDGARVPLVRPAPTKAPAPQPNGDTKTWVDVTIARLADAQSQMDKVAILVGRITGFTQEQTARLAGNVQWDEFVAKDPDGPALRAVVTERLATLSPEPPA